MYKNIETERLLIRPITTDDKDFIRILVNSQGWLKFIGDRSIHNDTDAENYILKILNNKNYFYSVFELKEGKLPIGIVTFLHRDTQEFPDIGFAMLPEFEKNGYAFEATKRYLDELISEQISPKIIAVTIPENTASINLLKRLGLEFTANTISNEQTLAVYTLDL